MNNWWCPAILRDVYNNLVAVVHSKELLELRENSVLLFIILLSTLLFFFRICRTIPSAVFQLLLEAVEAYGIWT